jgi:hypothetical protein
MRDRVKRLRDREPAGVDLAEAARERDRQRAAYIRRHFNEDWTNAHLYHVTLCSAIGLERAADVVLCAAALAQKT